MQFRYCSKCDGDSCYCPAQLREHEHVVRKDRSSERYDSWLSGGTDGAATDLRQHEPVEKSHRAACRTELALDELPSQAPDSGSVKRICEAASDKGLELLGVLHDDCRIGGR